MVFCKDFGRFCHYLVKANLCNIFLFAKYFFRKNIACSKKLIKFAEE